MPLRAWVWIAVIAVWFVHVQPTQAETPAAFKWQSTQDLPFLVDDLVADQSGFAAILGVDASGNAGVSLRDPGKQFSDLVPLCECDVLHGALNARGDLAVLVRKYDPSAAVSHQVSMWAYVLPRGGSWTQQRLSSDGRDADVGSIALDDAGEVYAAWTEAPVTPVLDGVMRGPYFLRFDGTKAGDWQPAQNLGDPNGSLDVSGLSLATSAAGALVAVWRERSTEAFDLTHRVVMRTRGGTSAAFSPAETLSEAGVDASAPKLAANRQGTAVVAFGDSQLRVLVRPTDQLPFATEPLSGMGSGDVSLGDGGDALLAANGGIYQAKLPGSFTRVSSLPDDGSQVPHLASGPGGLSIAELLSGSDEPYSHPAYTSHLAWLRGGTSLTSTPYAPIYGPAGSGSRGLAVVRDPAGNDEALMLATAPGHAAAVFGGPVRGSTPPPPPVDAPKAEFDWSMPERILGPAQRFKVTNPETRAKKFRVNLDACASTAAAGPLAYDWTVEGPGISGRLRSGPKKDCAFGGEGPKDAFFFEGFNGADFAPGDRAAKATYRVTLTVTDALGHSSSQTREITPMDYLIVSLGDSVASGEGNPDVSSQFQRKGLSVAPIPGEWGDNGDNDRRCHRSFLNARALAAAMLEGEDPHSSITFVDEACSGAKTAPGVLGPYAGLEPTFANNKNLPAQVLSAGAAIGDRIPAAVLASVGANDLGFSDIVKICAAIRHCGRRLGPTMPSRLADLRHGLSELDICLLAGCSGARPLLRASRQLIITEYFDPTRNERGQFCSDINLLDHLDSDLPLGRERFLKEILKMILGETTLGGPLLAVIGGAIDDAGHIRGDEAAWAYSGVLEPLNREVREAAAAYGWTAPSGIASGFRNHGYCAADQDRWIRRFDESVLSQAVKPWPGGAVPALAGGMHPNGAGQVFYRDRLLDAVRRRIRSVQGQAFPAAVAPLNIVRKRGVASGVSGTLGSGARSGTVQVAVVRTSGAAVSSATRRARRLACQSLERSGALSKPRATPAGSCVPASWLSAKGSTTWSFRFKRRLPAGRYVAYARLRRAAADYGQIAVLEFRQR